MRRHSGLQRSVLILYRECLLASRRLPTSEGALAAATFVRSEFRAKAFGVEKMDFQRVEHLIRHGKKQLEAMTAPGVNITGFSVRR